MKVLLDSSVVISFLTSDIYTKEAEEIFSSIFDGKLDANIAEVTVVEVCGVMSRQGGREKANEVFTQLSEWTNKGIISILEHKNHITKIACDLAINYKLKGADAVISATAVYYKLKLITFDNEIITRLDSRIEFYKI